VIKYLKFFFLLFGIGLIATPSLAFQAIADTVKINNLLNKAEAYERKNFLDEASFKSGLKFANLAEQISIAKGLDNFLGKTYLVKSKLFAKRPANDSVQAFAEKAMILFRKTQEKLLEADAQVQYASYIKFRFASMPRSEILCDSALSIYKRLAPNSLRISKVFYLKALISWVQHQPEAAISYCRKVINVLDAIHHPQKQQVYALLGIIYGNRAGSAKGFAYSFKSLQLAEQYGDSSIAFSASASIGGFYQAMNQPAKWLSYIKKSKTFVSYDKDNNHSVTIAGYLAEAYIANGKYQDALAVLKEALKKGNKDNEEYRLLYLHLMDCYVYLKQFENAKKIYPQVLSLSSLPKKLWLFQTLARFSLMRFFIATRQFEKVRPHLLALKDEHLIEGYVNLKLSVEQFTYKVDSAQGNYNSALTHFQRYTKLNDSVNTQNHNKEVSQLQIQYETQKKDFEISRKNKNIIGLRLEAKLREAGLKSRTLSRNVSIAAAALFLLLLILGFNRYRMKQKTNLELERQQAMINNQNASLKVLLSERDWLLKEVHHRTKNNLQIVISLLNAQLANVSDSNAYALLKESQHRMFAMSLIHQRLYQSENISGIEMNVYLKELIEYLRDSFNVENRGVFQVDLDPLTLDISQAIPMGLIVNEAITNSIKYAFLKNNNSGTVKVQLNTQNPEKILLSISDSGNGLPENFDPKKSRSLGIKLMFGLAKQLRSELSLINDCGLSVVLTMPRERLNKAGVSNEYPS